ncbi:MAG TPA: VOC family protein [Aggregatilineaceae bacterium]|nr:VOC family protein [Aggregatilineaceae bacterium]
MALGNVTQIGLVVRNIADAAQAWSALLGVPVPEIITTDPVEKAHTEYQGQPSTARAKLAFFHLGQVDIELIEPLGEPSTWRDQLNAHGTSLHHIAFQIKGMKDQIAALADLGLPLVQKGEYEGGRYAYLDAQEQLGTVLELLEND